MLLSHLLSLGHKLTCGDRLGSILDILGLEFTMAVLYETHSFPLIQMLFKKYMLCLWRHSKCSLIMSGNADEEKAQDLSLAVRKGLGFTSSWEGRQTELGEALVLIVWLVKGLYMFFKLSGDGLLFSTEVLRLAMRQRWNQVLPENLHHVSAFRGLPLGMIKESIVSPMNMAFP